MTDKEDSWIRRKCLSKLALIFLLSLNFNEHNRSHKYFFLNNVHLHNQLLKLNYTYGMYLLLNCKKKHTN
jgi:hypothetical protein